MRLHPPYVESSANRANGLGIHGIARPNRAQGDPALLPQHQEQLEHASAIAPDVLAERGYRSVTASDPGLAGFADYQRAAGILIPLGTPDGSNGRYQLRRDRERVTTDPETGKQRAAKYEQATGQPHRLDVHPRNLAALADPSVPLWVTEGVKKGDALTSAGRCTIALGGVWCWRKECLPDWDRVALRGRTVLIAFDSDAETNPNVAKARDALAAFLTERGALVRIVHLPPAPDGSKVGADDFLASGGDLVDLVAEHTEDWTPTDGCPRELCRANRQELAERRDVARLEARILTAAKGTGIAPNRRLPYLLLGRRYFADIGRDRLQPERRAVVDADGWDRIPLQSMAADTGIGYATLLASRKELIASGVLEARERTECLDDGRVVPITEVRPTAPDLKAWMGQLATVVQAPTGWGGARYRCPVHHDAKVVTRHVCAVCGEDAELVGTDFQLENRSSPTPPPEIVFSPPTVTTVNKIENRSTSPADFHLENRSTLEGADSEASGFDQRAAALVATPLGGDRADRDYGRWAPTLEERVPRLQLTTKAEASSGAPPPDLSTLAALAERRGWAPLATRHGTVGGTEEAWRRFVSLPPPWLPDALPAMLAGSEVAP